MFARLTSEKPLNSLKRDKFFLQIFPFQVCQSVEQTQKRPKKCHFVHIGSDTRKKFWKGHSSTPVDTFGGKPRTVTLELPVLKQGCRGDSVMALQTLLKGYGYDTRDSSWGVFDDATQKALVEYQKGMDLEADGSCGRKTWSELLGV